MQSTKFDKSWLLFLAAAAIFLAIKINAAHYAVSDENTYYKMGQLVAEGQVPYKDFFFAHTPLQVYLYAAIFKVFGFNILMLKLLSAAAVIIAAAFIFALVKEKLGPKAALAAAALFLFSYGTLLFSNFPTGVEVAIAFAAASFHFFMQRRFFISGLLAGLAAATAQLSIVAFTIMAATLLLQKDKKPAYRLLLGFMATAGTISLAFLAVAKGEFIRQTIIYHLNKPSESIDKPAVLLRIAKTNWLLFASAAAAAVSRYRARVSALLPLAIGAAYIAAFPLMKSSFNYYALYAFPFLAVAGGYGLMWLHEILTARIRLTQGIAVAAIAAVVILGGFSAVRQFNSYDFQDFPAANDIAAYVKENSLRGQTIFGDDSTVPLISLLSGREVALNYADNNAMRYQSGATDLETTLKLLQDDMSKEKLKFVLLRRIETSKGTYDFGIGTERKFVEFVGDNCELAASFGQHRVYDCLKT